MRLSGLVPIISYLSTVIADSTSVTEITTCNPLKASNCSPDPALATAISNDFHESSSHYLPYRTPSKISYSDDGLSLTLAERFDNPSLVSDYYIMFGKVEVWLKSAYGQGVISSFYLQSDDLDEIDLEWFGGDASQMQSNFFSKGDTTTYSRGGYHDMADPRSDYHNYTLDWTTDYVKWYIDGTLVRTLSKDDPQGFPQSPMRLYFGIWAGGDPSNAEGTIEWAGGLSDYSQVPFSMHINKLIVADYSSGSSYVYGDNSGTWESIKAVDGEVNGRVSIAQAEFASLVNGNVPSSDSSVSKSLSIPSIPSSTLSSSSSSSSSSFSSSSIESTTSYTPSTTTSSTILSQSSFIDDDSEETDENEISTSSTISSTSSLSPEHRSKRVSLKSEYLTSSTKTFETRTTGTEKNESESTKTESHSKSSTSLKISSAIEVSSNIAPQFNRVSNSSFTALLVFALCLF